MKRHKKNMSIFFMKYGIVLALEEERRGRGVGWEIKKSEDELSTLSIFFFYVALVVVEGCVWIYLSLVGVVLDIEGSALITVGHGDLVPVGVGSDAIEEERKKNARKTDEHSVMGSMDVRNIARVVVQRFKGWAWVYDGIPELRR